MAKTIRETAIDLLKDHGWKISGRGAGRSQCWVSTRTDLKVYVGSGYGIRIGKTKATSLSITLDRLGVRLQQIGNALPAVKEVEEVKAVPRITDLRRRCHAVIQTWNEDQCLALLAIDVAGVDLAKLTQPVSSSDQPWDRNA